MKRSRLTNRDIADWGTLCHASFLAARGKRDREQVRRFFDDFDEQIRQLSIEILHNTIRLGQTTTFQIFDPKLRTIHAPIFRERILHHALIHHIGPVLDRALIDDTYACRVGKGAIAAVQRAQTHCRRFPWYAKIDVRQYFPGIDHSILFQMVKKKFQDPSLQNLIQKVIDSHAAAPGKGLPIGALTSQHFANYYLNALDRYLLETIGVRGLVRYMDDTVFWCDSKEEAQQAVVRCRIFLHDQLCLSLHEHCQVNRSTSGVTFCGYRVLPGTILLTQRRRQLYAAARTRWESRFCRGEISANQLQSGYSAALGIVIHADSAGWRRLQLARVPVLEACDEG
jgi:RNA-directed DNA polymerase